jgi:hypothetical protein
MRASSLLVILACVAGGAGAADDEAGAREVIERINAFRIMQGRESLSVSEALAGAARDFAAFMAQAQEYGHAADGRTAAERVRAQGYDFCLVLENIAQAYDSRGLDSSRLAATLTEGWTRSPGHRANLLDADALETGVGRRKSLRPLDQVPRRGPTVLARSTRGAHPYDAPRVKADREVKRCFSPKTRRRNGAGRCTSWPLSRWRCCSGSPGSFSSRLRAR